MSEWERECIELARKWFPEWQRGNIGKGVFRCSGSAYLSEPMNEPERAFIRDVLLWAGLVYQHARPKTPLERRRAQFDQERRRLFWILVGRDGELCVECGATEKLTVDHVTPLAAGGSDELSNLQILCHSCNSRKGAR